MTFDEAQAQFALRYYHWAREQFRSEVERGFPLLKRLDTGASRTCLHWMRQLTPDNQFKLAAALVKRFHKQALQVTGEGLGEWETEMLKRYTDSILLIPGHNEDRLQQEGRPPNLNRKNFARVVKERLAPVLMRKPERHGGGIWFYTNQVGALQLETYLNFGGRFSLSYAHHIIFSGHRLLEFASIESWLGLSSQTHWFYLDESDVEETAQLIAELCALFLEAAPKLVEGISP